MGFCPANEEEAEKIYRALYKAGYYIYLPQQGEDWNFNFKKFPFITWTNMDNSFDGDTEKPEQLITLSQLEGVEEGFELNDKDYIYCGCYEVVESTANWLGKKGFKVNGCTIVGSTSGFDCLEYNVNEGWSISQRMSCINKGRQIHIEDLERVKPKLELPEIDGYKGKIVDGKIVYGSQSISIEDFKVIYDTEITFLCWGGEHEIDRSDIDNIHAYLKQENLI